MSRIDRRLARKQVGRLGSALPTLQTGLAAVQQLQGAFGDAKSLVEMLTLALGRVTGLEHELARQRYVTKKLLQTAAGAPQGNHLDELESQYRTEFDKLHEAGEGT